MKTHGDLLIKLIVTFIGSQTRVPRVAWNAISHALTNILFMSQRKSQDIFHLLEFSSEDLLILRQGFVLSGMESRLFLLLLQFRQLS